jgi:hypothetical protein
MMPRLTQESKVPELHKVCEIAGMSKNKGQPIAGCLARVSALRDFSDSPSHRKLMISPF